MVTVVATRTYIEAEAVAGDVEVVRSIHDGDGAQIQDSERESASVS